MHLLTRSLCVFAENSVQQILMCLRRELLRGPGVPPVGPAWRYRADAGAWHRVPPQQGATRPQTQTAPVRRTAPAQRHRICVRISRSRWEGHVFVERGPNHAAGIYEQLAEDERLHEQLPPPPRAPHGDTTREQDPSGPRDVVTEQVQDVDSFFQE